MAKLRARDDDHGGRSMPDDLARFRLADWYDPADAQGPNDEERFANAAAAAKARQSEARWRWRHEHPGVPLPIGVTMRWSGYG